MSKQIRNILVLCTGNSARSILAEAIINRLGEGRLCAFSAGSHPKGAPHPLAIELLERLGHDAAGLRSKSWHEFSGPNAPSMDLIITVCDAAAGESCPYWPGHPLVAHWGIPDPAAAEGTGAERRAAFELAYRRLRVRVAALVALPIERMSEAELRLRLGQIGDMEGATGTAAQS